MAAAPPSMAFLKAISIIPHITGGLSLLGNVYILCDILKDNKKQKRTYTRFLFGASFYDLFSSFGFFLSSWPIPSGPYAPYQASGTTASCTFQGFIIQIGLASGMYNTGLSIYYLLVMVFNWPENRVKSIEKYIHSLTFVLGVCTAIAGLFLTLFNDATLWCWIASYPSSCGNARSTANPEECERGANAWIYRWAFFYIPGWISTFVITFCMGWLTYDVCRKERKSRKWRMSSHSGGGQDKTLQLSRQVFWQSIHYCLVFYTTIIFPTIHRLQQTLNTPTSNFVIIAMCTLAPLRGFFNFTVYIRPRYLKYCEQNPSRYWFQNMWKAIRSRLPTVSDKISSAFGSSKKSTRVSKNKNNKKKSASNDEEQCAEGTNTTTTGRGGGHDDSSSPSPVELNYQDDADVMDPGYALMAQRTTIVLYDHSQFIMPNDDHVDDDEEEEVEEDSNKKDITTTTTTTAEEKMQSH